MKVTVVYALPMKQTVVQIELAEGSNVQQAIEMSHFLEKFPEIDLLVNKVGIFAKVCKLVSILEEGDRVEIYRPLPKKSRNPYRKSKKSTEDSAKKDGN